MAEQEQKNFNFVYDNSLTLEQKRDLFKKVLEEIF